MRASQRYCIMDSGYWFKSGVVCYRKAMRFPWAAVCAIISLHAQGSRAADGDEFWDNRQRANGWILTMAVQGADLLVAGQFSQVGGIVANNIARWDGTNWFPLGTGVDGR